MNMSGSPPVRLGSTMTSATTMLRPLTTYASRNQPLDALAERVGGADEQSWPPRGEVERVAGVENDLACEALDARRAGHVLGGSADDRQNDQVAELRSLGERADSASSGRLRASQVIQLRGIA